MKNNIINYNCNQFKISVLGGGNSQALTSDISDNYTQRRHISAMICAAFGSFVFIKL